MSDHSAIEWTERTWNPTTGCDRISPGCDRCYALTLAKRLKAMGQAKYQTDGDPRTSGPGFGVAIHPGALREPLTWRRPSICFVDSMADVLHARVPTSFVAQVWAVMALTPQHTYQILTKRPERYRKVLEEPCGCGGGHLPGIHFRSRVQDHTRRLAPGREVDLMAYWPLENVWLGTSIESDRYTWRADALRAAPATTRFLSLEPLLGPLPSLDLDGIDWVIVGGESGPGARPMDLARVRDLVQQCEASGVAVFVKQLGAVWARANGADPKGGHWEQWPEDLRVRQFPNSAVVAARGVMNTIGKKGRLGEGVRCVVSVSMLTEGWDANTVTHILGVRAFGTQLLCEQVVGRGLRRRSYAPNDRGFFEPEYAEIYGVPFSFIPASGSTPNPKPHRPPTHVYADPARVGCEITFPRLVGYRVELPDEPLHADFGDDSRLVLAKTDLPSKTEVAGVVGATEIHTLGDLRAKREQEIAFQLARLVLDRHLRDGLQNPRPWLFPQLVGIAKAWLRECVVYHDDTFSGLLLITETAHRAAEKIWHGFFYQQDNRESHTLPMLRPYDPVGTTADVDFDTTKRTVRTDEERCHVTHVVCDSGWEDSVAQVLEELPEVEAYVKNDHLGFTVPYTFQGQNKQYYPDFLVRLRDPGDGLTRMLIVEVSGYKPVGPTEEKSATARNFWVPAVNNHGGFGRWHYLEITDPTVAKADLRAAFKVLYADTPLERLLATTRAGQPALGDTHGT